MQHKYWLKTFLLVLIVWISNPLKAQMMYAKGGIKIPEKKSREFVKHDVRRFYNGVQKRDASNPAICATDTSLYADIGSSLDYRLVFLGNGQNLGIFFNAPQELTVKGFRFFAFLPWDTVAQVTSTDVWCKIYKAGVDSMPMGKPIDSVKVTIDTIQGNLNFVNTIHDAVFAQPLTIDHNYVLTIESDGSGASAANVVTNNWTTADGLGLNLSKIQLNDRWYHAKDVNIDGISFDANFLIYPFVSYNLIAGFTNPDDCYAKLDTLRFKNQYKNSIVSSPFYNEYAYYDFTGFGSWCHSWTFNDTAELLDQFDGVYKPNSKFNITAKLVSYTVPYSRSLDLCYDSAQSTVYFKPDRPALSDTNGCIGANEQLQLISNNEATYFWHTDSSSTPFQNGTSYAINNFNKDVTYYITAENNGNSACNWDLEPVSFKLTAYPDTLTLDANTINVCTGAFAVLEGKSNRGTVWWYDGLTATEPVAKGDIFQTPALNVNTNYYAEANNLGCAIKTGRVRVGITVSSGFAPAAPTVTGNEAVCVPLFQSSQVTLNATPASGSSIRWYNSAVSTSVVSTQNTYTVDVYDRGDVYVYAQSWNGACGSSRLPIKVRGNRAPDLQRAQAEDGCFGDSLRLTGFGNWGDLDWYTDTNSAPVVTGNFVAMKLTDSGERTIFIKVREGNCVNDSFYRLKVMVKPTVLPKSIVSENVCRGSEASIELKGLNKETSILWYETGNSDDVISGDSTLNLGRIFSTTTRYVETLYRGCRSERKPITVDVLDQPVAGFRVSYPTVQSIALEPINTRNMTIDWSFGDGNTSKDLQPTHTYAAAGKYQVRMIANSTLSKCADTSQAEVSVTLNSIDMVERHLAVYPNPVVAGSLLHLQMSTAEPIQHVRMLDLRGRLVFETNSLNQNTFLLPSYLSEGIYAVTVATGNKTYSQLIQVSK